MIKQDLSKYTPAVRALCERIGAIDPTSRFIDDDIQVQLVGMTAKDIDRLLPPPMSNGGLWTDDAGFCKRLGAYIFGVSPETIDDMPANYYNLLVAVVTANFLMYLGQATS